MTGTIEEVAEAEWIGEIVEAEFSAILEEVDEWVGEVME